ncbi:MAG TPA: GNAT family N-acetyltransferase [Chitinophagales bacterium]|nr:GNAT family N-acetyltransferase [Chitinophagales bacterium]
MPNITVTPIAFHTAEVNAFIKFAWKIYKDDPNWVPPLMIDMKKRLNPDKDPFFTIATMQLFMAYQNGTPVGRIAAIENRLAMQVHQNKTGFFGYFECINNQEVANALFDAAENWLRARGLNMVQGPANPSINHEYGLLIDGFDDPPRLMMTYNPPYYINLIKNAQYQEAQELYAYKLDAANVDDNPKLPRIAKAAAQRYNVSIRPINLKNLKQDLSIIKAIYNEAWEKNWGAVPMTNEEIDALANDLKPLVEPNLAVFAEIEGKPVGFILAVPDYNYIFKQMNGSLFPFNFIKLYTQKKNIKWVRIIIMGVLPQYRRRGIDAVMYQHVIETSRKMGILYGEASWILESNVMMNRAAQTVLNGTVYKKYMAYEKQLHINANATGVTPV